MELERTKYWALRCIKHVIQPILITRRLGTASDTLSPVGRTTRRVDVYLGSEGTNRPQVRIEVEFVHPLTGAFSSLTPQSILTAVGVGSDEEGHCIIWRWKSYRSISISFRKRFLHHFTSGTGSNIVLREERMMWILYLYYHQNQESLLYLFQGNLLTITFICKIVIFFPFS